MNKVQETANAQRKEAKQMLCLAVGLPGNIMSSSIDKAVDCIISAAMLEAVMVINQSLQEQVAYSASSDNPNAQAQGRAEGASR